MRQSLINLAIVGTIVLTVFFTFGAAALDQLTSLGVLEPFLSINQVEATQISVENSWDTALRY
jgi:hypothetical protein